MSNFQGKMREYSNISIDKFDNENLNSNAYFLSHCHSDHMIGLGDDLFYHRLESNSNIFIYCSEVTKILIKNKSSNRFNRLGKYMKTLPIDESTSIIISDNRNVHLEILVTLLAAGHCPGSVMFLFEGVEGTVLYTGDFRFHVGEASRISSLHCNGRIKDIESIYVDTTFCIPTAGHLPTREESCKALIKIIDDWIYRGNNYVIMLNCRTNCGYEYLFLEIFKSFGLKIHVLSNKILQYKNVADIQDCLTVNRLETSIHACSESKYTSCYMHFKSKCLNVLTIQPTVMWYNFTHTEETVVKNGNFVRVCYSMHSSYEEIRDFVGYLEPVNIYPNVIPVKSSYEDVYNRLKDLSRSCKSIPGGISINSSPDFKLLKSRKRSYSHIISNQTISENESLELEDKLQVHKNVKQLVCGKNNGLSDSSQNSSHSTYSQKSSLNDELELFSIENSEHLIIGIEENDIEEKENTNNVRNDGIPKMEFFEVGLKDFNSTDLECSIKRIVPKKDHPSCSEKKANEFKELDLLISNNVCDTGSIELQESFENESDECSSSPSLLQSLTSNISITSIPKIEPTFKDYHVIYLDSNILPPIITLD